MKPIVILALLALCALPASAQSEAPPSAPVSVWTQLNAEGVEHFGAGRLEAACVAFEKALAAVKDRDAGATKTIRGNLVKALITRAVQARDAQRIEDAERLLRAALVHEPTSSSVWTWLGVLRVDAGFLDSGEDALREALRHDETNAAAWFQLGMVQYRRERLERAVADWSRALELDDSLKDAITPWLEKARRELAFEAQMQTESSSHFVCKFGKELDRARVGEVLKMLESVYLDAGQRLGVWPREMLTVVLYADREFAAATGAHGWVGGLFDGKVRLPVRNWERRRPHIEATLRHEYTHFLVRQLAPDCPAWLNEGLAQLAEGKTAKGAEHDILALEARGALLPLDDLVHTFARFGDPMQARLAYLQSLALVEYLEKAYGIADVTALLGALGRKGSFDEAFTRVFRRSPAAMRAEWLRSLEG